MIPHHSSGSGHASFSGSSGTPETTPAPRCSIAQCVNLAIRNELPTIQRLALSTEVDLDEVPGESANPQSQQAIHQFLHELIEIAKPQSHLAITLINGNSQWELEVAAEFNGVRTFHQPGPSPTTSPTSIPGSAHLREVAFACGGELEQWDCPQGGQAIVLVVAKHRRGEGTFGPHRRAA
ncbi:MAG: hypothetical protein ACK49R_07355 [Planctomycetota bacterium]|jgi:hypothetical protein